MFEARELVVSTLEQQRHARAVLDIGSVHFGAQHKAPSIDQDMAFAAIDALGAIVATDAADPSRAYGLAVDNAGGGVGVAPDGDAELLTQDSVQVFPGAIETPHTEIVIRSLPGCELVREQPPSAATPYHVEDAVQDLTERMQARPADTLGWRQQRVQTSKLSIGQVREVGSPRGQTPAILP